MLILPLPPRSTLFPYTTLFRSSLRLRSGHASRLRMTPGRTNELRTQNAECRIEKAGGGRFLHSSFCILRSAFRGRSEEHTSELQSHHDLVCRLLLEKKKEKTKS